MRQHPSPGGDEQFEQSELLRRQPDLLVAAHDAMAIVIDLDVSDPHWTMFRRRVDCASPQGRAQARQQLLGAERLGHVVVGAEIERLHLVGLRVARREHDDRHGRPAADDAAHLDARHIRQPEIEEHEIGRVLAHLMESVCAARGGRYLVSVRAQEEPDRRLNGGLIVHEQHAHAPRLVLCRFR